MNGYEQEQLTLRIAVSSSHDWHDGEINGLIVATRYCWARADWIHNAKDLAFKARHKKIP